MSRGATARLFAALDPPPAVCRELAWWGREVSAVLRGPGAAAAPHRARVRLLAPEAMHITLCFLGSRPVGELQALATALEECEESVGELSVGAPVWLPPRRPRALALEVGDRDGRLERLQGLLVESFARAIEWQPERRRWRAHVTVARLGRGSGDGRGDRRRARRESERRAAESHARRAAAPDPRHDDPAAAILPPTPQLTFTPSALVLYRSWLGSQGARYEALAARALTASDSPSSSSSPEES